MKVFEFQFNPKTKQDRFLKVFSFEPKDTEDRTGGLYIIGELTKALPSNAHFLDRLAAVVKDEYYGKEEGSVKKARAPEARLKSALRVANEFLSQETKQGNTDWIGNLHYAVATFVSKGADTVLYFTKVGEIKIWIARNNALVDLGKKLEDPTQKVSPSHVFGNVVSGKVIHEDRLIVLTKDLFDVFVKTNLVSDLAFLKEEKQFSSLFKSKEKSLFGTSGTLFEVLIEETPVKKDRKGGKGGLLYSQLSLFGLKIGLPAQVSLPWLGLFRKNEASKAGGMIFKIPHVKIPRIVFPKSVPVFSAIRFHNKNIVFVAVLVLLLLGGFVIFKSRDANTRKEIEQVIQKIEILKTEAEQAFSMQKEKEANMLLQEAWEIIEPYRVRKEFPNSDLKSIVQTIVRELDEKLAMLNKIENIEHPEVYVEIRKSETVFEPHHMVFGGSWLHFFDPSSSELYSYDMRSKNWRTKDAGKNILLGTPFGDSAAFFTESNRFLVFRDGERLEESALRFSQFEFEADGMANLGKNLYFFDSTSGEILKYPNPLFVESVSSLWIQSSEKRPNGIQSIAIDENVWVLAKDGTLEKYYKGRHEETVEPLIFPKLQAPREIQTNDTLSDLYILDPTEKRLIVLSKTGDIVKQYRSSKFDNLVDFAISSDGKEVYLLNGLLVYRIRNE